MDFQRNAKYFSQKNKTYPIIISAALIAIGFIMVVFLSNTRGISSRLMMYIGFPVLAAGVIYATVFSAVKIKDSEIDDSVKSLTDSFTADFRNRFIQTDIKHIRYNAAHGITEPKAEPVIFGTYCFDNTDPTVKRGSDGQMRSSVYSLSGFMMKHDSLCLAERKSSLISTDAPSDNFTERQYASLKNAALIDPPEGKYHGTTKYKHLVITGIDGNTVIEFPILADADADEYAFELSKRITNAAGQIKPE